MLSTGVWVVHLLEGDCDLQLSVGFSLVCHRRLPFSIRTTSPEWAVTDSQIIMPTEPRKKGFARNECLISAALALRIPLAVCDALGRRSTCQVMARKRASGNEEPSRQEMAESKWVLRGHAPCPRSGETVCFATRCVGGEGGIRTHETVSRLHAFQACAFDHSATSPGRSDP